MASLSVKITQADINILHTLEPRKSILNFTETELTVTEKWAEKFQDELSEKSPFYRLIHGDWREDDESRVPIIDVEDKSATFQSVSDDIKLQIIQRGIITNTDTNWNIQISRRGLEDTLTYGRNHKDQNIYNIIYKANNFVSDGILLDSTVTEKNNNNKAFNSMFMHKLYGICKIDKQPYIVKISIEEFAGNKNDTIKRLYNLQDINIEPIKRAAFADKRLALSVLNGSDISISDLFKLVKAFDKDFYLNKRSEKQIEKFPTGERKEIIKMSEKKRLFVDMDGTLAEFKVVDTLEKLYEPHYFERLKPNESVVEAVKDIVNNHPEIDVYILSAVLSDSKYALPEKKNWIKEYLPEISEDRCIFPPCGSDKKDFIPDGIRSDDFLLDDYSLNLNSWEPPARGIKLLNGINGNNGTWDKDSVSYLNSGKQLSEKICAIVSKDARITEPRPQDMTDEEKFIARVNEIAEWSEEVQAKAAERQAEQEKQNYNR